MHDLSTIPYEMHFNIMIYLSVKDALVFLSTNKDQIADPFVHNKAIQNSFWGDLINRDFSYIYTKPVFDCKSNYMMFFKKISIFGKEWGKELIEMERLTDDNMQVDLTKW
jgi:hypothetical protein